MPTQKSVVAAALLCLSASVAAQTGGGAQPSGVTVTELVASQCPVFSSRVVDRPELKSILSQRPVDIAAVCTCTQRSFVADARLQAALNVDEQTLIIRMKEERMKAYLTMRLMASVLACLTPELERSLAVAKPIN